MGGLNLIEVTFDLTMVMIRLLLLKFAKETEAQEVPESLYRFDGWYEEDATDPGWTLGQDCCGALIAKWTELDNND